MMSMQRVTKNKTKASVLLGLMFTLALCSGFTLVSASASINPSSGTVMIGIPNQFTVVGLNSSRTYDISLDGSEIQSSLAPSSDGRLIFQITFTSEGNHIVTVSDTYDDSTVATASMYAQDIVGLIIAFLAVVFVIVLVLRIFNKASDII